jgi:hypothetical protein
MSRHTRRPPGSLSPVSVQPSTEWAISTAGGLVVQGPSRRSMLRTLAPDTPPLFRPGELPVGKQQRTLLRPSPLIEVPLSPTPEAPSIPRASRRKSRDSTQMGAEDAINSFNHAGAVDTSPDLRGSGDAWAVSTAGGLQITGPSRRWMMRESAPSTPTAMRPITGHTALQRARGDDQHTPSGQHETVAHAQDGGSRRISSLMHSRFGHALNRLNQLLQDDEEEDGAPLVEGDSSADELVLQLEMLVDQLEASALEASTAASYAQQDM